MSTGASNAIGAGNSASAMSNFPGGFGQGVTVQGLPVLNTYGGRVFWVDSNNGSDQNKGTFARPFASIAGALAVMVSAGFGYNNDILIAKDGHMETLASAKAIDIQQVGLTLIGLGNNRRKPTIRFTTSTAASIGINAPAVRISGFRFVNGIASLVTMFDLASEAVALTVGAITLGGQGGASLFTFASGVMPAEGQAVVFSGTSSTGLLLNQVYYANNVGTLSFELSLSPNGPSLSSISANAGPTLTATYGVASDGQIDNCEFYEGGSTTGLAFIDLVNTAVANAADRFKIYNNKFLNPTAGNYTAGINLSVVNDQIEVVGNYFDMNCSLSCLHNPTAKVMTNLTIANNYIRNLTAAKNASQLISASTGQVYGNTFIPGDNTAAGFVPGSTVLSGGNVDILGAMDVGEAIIIKRTVISSNIKTATPTTLVTAAGEVLIDNIVVKSDATGLAGGTNFQIASNNAKGLLNILVESVANLGANKTVDLNSASVTKQRTSIETTKVISTQNSVADGTGAGTVDIIIYGRRVTAGAVLV